MKSQLRLVFSPSIYTDCNLSIILDPAFSPLLIVNAEATLKSQNCSNARKDKENHPNWPRISEAFILLFYKPPSLQSKIGHLTVNIILYAQPYSNISTAMSTVLLQLINSGVRTKLLSFPGETAAPGCLLGCDQEQLLQISILMQRILSNQLILFVGLAVGKNLFSFILDESLEFVP